MNARTRFATVSLTAIGLLMPFQASALSVKQFNAQTKDEEGEFLSKTVDKIAGDVAKVDPVLSKAIRDWFEGTPGKGLPPGLLAFAASLIAVTDLGDKGKLELDKVKTEGILLAVIKTNLMNKQAPKDKQPVAPARGETVYQFLLLDDNAQVKEIQRLCGNVVAAFSKKTDGDKPIPEGAYQDQRQAANLLRALVLRGSVNVRDSLYPSVIFQIKETASTNPFAGVVDSLRTIVFQYLDKFKSATIVKDSDTDQQAYFLNHYMADFQKSSDDYNKQMEQIRRRADELEKELDQQEQKLRQELQESHCRDVRLHDGRQVFLGKDGEYVDVSGQILHSADEAKARGNGAYLSYQETLKKYRECLAEHAITNLDRTAGKQ